MNYEKLAQKTECKYDEDLKQRMVSQARLLHHCIGLCTETGELQDAVKKHIFYGKELDITNVLEEVQDILWYVAGICNTFNVSIEEMQDKNIAKLKARYGEKFSSENAIDRNLEKERQILEKL